MARKRKRQAIHGKVSPDASKLKGSGSTLAHSRRSRNLSVGSLPGRSSASRDAALHVLAAMRRDPKLPLVHASKLESVRPGTVQKYFGSALKKVKGQWRVSKSDRFREVLYVPDASGNAVPVETSSLRERQQLSSYLRDIGRHFRGNRRALRKWDGKTVAGAPLVTDDKTLRAIEPALADFSLYRASSGGAA